MVSFDVVNVSSMSEKEFLSNYDINKFDRPSVTADVAVFTLNKEKENCYRKNPEMKLGLLLVKRGTHPCIGKWALPGGFVELGETIEDCAFRKIKDKTGVIPVSLMPIGSFSEAGRDPRGWIISNAFAFVVSEDQLDIVNGVCEADIGWFEVSFEVVDDVFRLSLVKDDVILSATLREVDCKFGRKSYEILDSDGLAFDHAKIIASAIGALRSASENIEMALDFLPEKFTLAALQKVQEVLSGRPLIAANFRRKIADLVEETAEFYEGVGHRPARFYRRKH